MRTSTIFAFGAFGGCCPTIARLASFYSTNPNGNLPEFGVYIAIGLFALLGAFIAVGFGAREMKAAIVAGIAAPGLVTNIVNGASAAGDANAPPAFIAAAYAQEADPVVEPLGSYRGLDVLSISAKIDGPAPDDWNMEFRFVAADGSTLRAGGTLVPGESLEIPVPVGATAISVGPRTVQLGQGTNLNVTIRTTPTLGGDLLWALGGERRYKVEDVSVDFSR